MVRMTSLDAFSPIRITASPTGISTTWRHTGGASWSGSGVATTGNSAPLVAHNLVEVIAGRKADEAFDGYTSCPLITREGSAMLIEFDYEGRLTPSLPMIEPLNDSFFAWLMKYRMLKPAYMAVLKGRV